MSEPAQQPAEAPGVVSTTEPPLAPPTAPAELVKEDSGAKDVQMLDAQTPAAQTATTPSATPAAIVTSATATPANTTAPPVANNAPSPLPARTSTPMRSIPPAGGNGEQQPPGTGSRAASAHPDPAAGGFTMPAEAAVHGAPVRQYINGKITRVLLEGMKMVAKEQPKDPLRVLGEFLIQRSKELEEGK